MNDTPIPNKKAYTVPMARANILGLAFLVPVFLFYSLPFLWLWGLEPVAEMFNASTFQGILFLLILSVGIVAHELLHGLTWQIAGKIPRSEIEYNIIWKLLTPYAHCKVPMGIRAYRLGGLMPGLVLGIIPALLALLAGNAWLLAFGMLFTWAAGGDFLILWLLRKVEPGAMVEDHPSQAGCYVLEPEAPSPPM